MNRPIAFLVLFAILPFAFAATCTLSAFPDTIDAGKTSMISISYSGRTESSNAFVINCGNGHSVAAFGCKLISGSCHADCYYPATGYFSATASVDGSACTPASVAVNAPAASCGDGICDTDIGESPDTCPVDCGELRYCGDGICDYAESPTNCPTDCGVAPNVCSDGTRNSTCSATKPYYCINNLLVNKSALCGCPEGFVAKNEYCVEKTCSDGTAKNTCSIQKPLYCNSTAQLEEKSSQCGCPQGTTPSSNTCLAPGSCALFNAYANEVYRNVSKGTDAKYKLTISNPSSGTQLVSVSAIMAAGLYGEFSKSYISLPAGNTTYSELVLHTKSATEGSYQLFVTAEAANCKKDIPINITIYSNGTESACCSVEQALSASIDNRKDELYRQGDFPSYAIYLINEGSARVIVSLSAPTSPFEATFSKNEFEIMPGESDTARVSFRIPAGTPGNEYNIPIMIKYTNACCIRDFPIPISFSVYGARVMASMIGEPAPTCQKVYKGTQLATLKLGLRNDGDAENKFSLAVGEKSPLNGNVQISQQSINLKSGETGFFNIYISPSLLELQKTYSYTFSVSSNQFAILNRNYCFTVSPANESLPIPIRNTSLVILEMPEISTVDSENAKYEVRITNPTESTFYNLTLNLEGVTYSWYTFTGDKTTLGQFTTKTYMLSFTGRTYQEQSSIRRVLARIMSNGITIGSANTTIEVQTQNRSLDFTYTVQPTVESNNVISALEVRMNVINRGNIVENFVTPAIAEGTGLNYSTIPAYINLSPGESGMFTITFWPSTDKVASKAIPISIGTGNAETSKTVNLPAMTGLAVLAQPVPAWMTAILFGVALVAVMLILSRINEPQGMGKK
ncbi:MAG: hypothetical protein WC408_01035 [Candidatus Micrarchaeia archaeon]|jgi:hypothetical protein